MRKQAFCICENKDADQLRSNCEADQCLCFCYPSTFKIQIFKALIFFCDCTAQFVSDLVGNPEDRFSQDEAQIDMFIIKFNARDSAFEYHINSIKSHMKADSERMVHVLY